MPSLCRDPAIAHDITKLAVLIDADNARPAIVEGLLAEVAKYGTKKAQMNLTPFFRDDLDAIRAPLQSQHALGSGRFHTAIEAQLSRRAGPAKIVRPRKAPQKQPSKSAL